MESVLLRPRLSRNVSTGTLLQLTASRTLLVVIGVSGNCTKAPKPLHRPEISLSRTFPCSEDGLESPWAVLVCRVLVGRQGALKHRGVFRTSLPYSSVPTVAMLIRTLCLILSRSLAWRTAGHCDTAAAVAARGCSVTGKVVASEASSLAADSKGRRCRGSGSICR